MGDTNVLYRSIAMLAQYGIDCGLMPQSEYNYAVNLLLGLFHEEYYELFRVSGETIILETVLKELLDEACRRGIIKDDYTSRDLFDTKLMNCLTPRPGEVARVFNEKHKASSKDATDYFYALCQDSDYIRRYRITKDRKWTAKSAYGDIDITINLSKPEKDPEAIATAKTVNSGHYPVCQLCVENEGYAGRADFPSKENFRIIPIEILGEAWGFQYSPYVYYNEHCILLSREHVPMKINRDTFARLFAIVEMFPHYFVGSNADLPIVGGSILNHEHYQGGNYVFPLARAEIVEQAAIQGFEGVECGIVKWPMSVLRLRSGEPDRLVALAGHVLETWRTYTDKAVFLFSETNGIPHNTVTPIARMNGERYELDLVLRNNITTDEHPWGVYHPHREYHHIKKENIGLIETMGLAVLPPRLHEEMNLVAESLLQGRDLKGDDRTAKHAEWAERLRDTYTCLTARNVMGILEKEIGAVFVKILENAGVYKRTPEGMDAFRRFLANL